MHIPQMDWISLQLGYYSSTILSPLFLLTVKAPLIIADLGVGLLIYQIAKQYVSPINARRAFLFWFLNPFVIWTSSVHGAFDVLPAFFVLLSLSFLMKRQYLLSGLTLSIAIFYKIYPIYLVPLYAILIWTNLGQDKFSVKSIRNSISRFSIFLIGGLPAAIVSLAFVSPLDMFHTVFARGSYVSTIGGLSLWMLNWTPGFGWIWDIVTRNQGIIQLATTSIAFAISFLVGLRLVRHGVPSTKEILQAHVIAISAIFLTLLTVQPQYIIWILPSLALMVFTTGAFLKRAMLLSALSFLYQVALSGAAMLILLPLTYFGLNPDIITAPVGSIIIPFGMNWGFGLSAFGVVGGLVLLSFIRRKYPNTGLHITSPVLEEPRSDSGQLFHTIMSSLKSGRAIILVGFLLFLAVSAGLARTSSVNQFLASSLASNRNGNTLSTHGSFLVSAGSLPLQINIVAAPIQSLTSDQPVYIYYDTNYPMLGNDARGWQGITDHLPVDLRLRGYSGSIQIVNATGLHSALVSGKQSVVIIPSGTFPLTVENSTNSLVRPWLQSGGTLVWMGGAFGYYSGMNKTQPGPLETGLAQSRISQNLILDHTLVDSSENDTTRIASVTTQFSVAMNLTYSDVWVAPTVHTLKSLGGVALGHVQNSTDVSRASISMVPVGAGRLIVFGGPVSYLLTADGEDVVSHDLAQILFLGNLVSNAEVEYAGFTVPSRTSESINFKAAFNVTSLNARGLVLAAFSDYTFSRLYWKAELSAGS
jgi:hypothetical protein